MRQFYRSCVLVATPLWIFGLFSGIAIGQSIFDEDYKPKNTPAVIPEKQPTPAPNLHQPNRVAPKSTQTPPEPIEIHSPATAPAQAQESLESLAEQARSAIDKYKKRAEELGALEIEKNTEYITAQSHAAEAKDLLERARSIGTADEKAKASNAYLTAVSQLKHVRETIIAKNPAVQEANKLAAVGPGKPEVAPVKAEERPREILDGVRRHDLVQGMTFKEACQASRLSVQLIYESGNQKVYRWTIKGKTGTIAHSKYQVDGVLHTEYEATWGIVGYVDATFIDGFLTEYRRYR